MDPYSEGYLQFRAKSEGNALWAGELGLRTICELIEKEYEVHRYDVVLSTIWGSRDKVSAGIVDANKYIEDTQPFKLVKTDPEAVAKILYALLEACRWYAWMVHPVMPETSKKVFVQLGLNVEEELAKGWDAALVWGGLKPGAPLGEPTPLFPRLEQTEATA